MKTTRFATLVEAAGAPTVYLLWSPAEKDAAFQKAIEQHRVLSVHQETRGTKKDFGVVGFTKDPQAQFLVFPKSLRRFDGTRVVGIDYERLADDTRLAPAKPGFGGNSGGGSARAAPTSRVEKASAKSRGSGRAASPAAAPASLGEVVPFDAPARHRVEKSERKTAEPEKHAPPPKKQATTGDKPDPRISARTAATRPSRAASDTSGELKRVAAEVQKTLRELKAGKAVAAYERLQALAKTLDDDA